MKRQILCGIGLMMLGGTAAAATWQIEVTNVTRGQTFTPLLAASHYSRVHIFEPGMPAPDELQAIAEAGDIGPMTGVLEAQGYRVGGIAHTEGLLPPGQTVTLELEGRAGQRLSLAGMLIPTNDTFVGIDSVFLPVFGEIRLEVNAWDAGTEANDQNCLHIPGPRCGGEALSAPAATDEGYVYLSNGFHDLGPGDGTGEVLKPAEYTWNDPVALVTIKRIR